MCQVLHASNTIQFGGPNQTLIRLGVQWSGFFNALDRHVVDAMVCLRAIQVADAMLGRQDVLWRYVTHILLSIPH